MPDQQLNVRGISQCCWECKYNQQRTTQSPLLGRRRRCNSVIQSSTRDRVSSIARDVRPMPIKLITIGRGSSPGASLMAGEWLDKLRRYTTVTEIALKPNPKNTTVVPLQVQAEGERVLKMIAPTDYMILLDERGREMTSESLAKLLARAGDGGTPLVFCIGGPYGHGSAMRERANDSIRLSSMVLNHQVAHVVLLEQLYRAWTMLRGEPYHHV